MKAAVLGLVLLLSLTGCTRRQINDFSLLDYRSNDGVPETAGKTLVNLPGWAVLGAGFVAVGALALGFMAGIGYLQAESQARTGY